MSKPNYKELLTNFKQYNKVAREKKAIKEGYVNAAAYIAWLEANIKAEKSTSIPSPTAGHPPMKGNTVTPPAPPSPSPVSPPSGITPDDTWPTIHIVDVLDASGSMEGAKFMNALRGINAGIKDLSENKEPVKYTYSLCDFSDDVLFPHVKQDLDTLSSIVGRTRGSTALFDAIGLTITTMSPNLNIGDKVLVNIYTDGQENASRRFSARDISESIERLSPQGWTFTFIGTKQDVDYANSKLKIHTSNSLVYDGSAKGLEESLTKTRSARAQYSKSVSLGEDVSTGFYKDIN